MKYCNFGIVNERIKQVKARMFKINAILICTEKLVFKIKI